MNMKPDEYSTNKTPDFASFNPEKLDQESYIHAQNFSEKALNEVQDDLADTLAQHLLNNTLLMGSFYDAVDVTFSEDVESITAKNETGDMQSELIPLSSAEFLQRIKEAADLHNQKVEVADGFQVILTGDTETLKAFKEQMGDTCSFSLKYQQAAKQICYDEISDLSEMMDEEYGSPESVDGHTPDA